MNMTNEPEQAGPWYILYKGEELGSGHVYMSKRYQHIASNSHAVFDLLLFEDHDIALNVAYQLRLHAQQYYEISDKKAEEYVQVREVEHDPNYQQPTEIDEGY